VTVVIRSAGERTLHLCHRLVCEQIPDDQVFLITEAPFALAVRRTFEIGIEGGRKWTAAIDADVLVRSSAFHDLVELAEETAEGLFGLQGRVWDKLYGGPRTGGIHLYRTALLRRALRYADVDRLDHRPERSVAREMEKAGFRYDEHELVVGLHDFEQAYRDYFRKGASHARKHQNRLWLFQPMWRRRSASDLDIRVVLAGMEFGIAQPGLAITDIREAEILWQKMGDELDIGDKGPVDERAFLGGQIDEMVANLTPTPEFEVWNAWRLWRAEERAKKLLAQETAARKNPFENGRADLWFRVARGLRRLAARLLPWPVKHSIRKALE
jgi:hypothetical protein